MSWRRIGSVGRKEFLHMRRDPATLFFALAVPLLQLLILGFAIDTNVRHIRTVVADHCRTQESRILLEAFVNTDDFRIVAEVTTDAELHAAIVAGQARVGLKIPEDFSRKLLAGETAQVLILVDGSDSTVAGEAVNVGQAVLLQESLRRVLADRALPMEGRPRVLFNPDTRSANFFLPGLLVVLSQLMATMLTAMAVVREKDNGTLEQLFLTPVRPLELMLGKLAPYLALTLTEFCVIALAMRGIFGVAVAGNFLVLLAVAVPFVLTMLGLGLFISTRAANRETALQMVMGTVIPAIFLSGYIFPIDSMPLPFFVMAHLIPTTWLVDASRGVILRGAGWKELWPNALILCAMAVGALAVSTARFRKQLG